MKYSYDNSWDKFQEIFDSKKSLEDKWNLLIEYHKKPSSKAIFDELFDINIDEEKSEIQEWLRLVFDKNPVPENIKGLWIGIVKMWNEEDDNEFYVIYLQGSDSFNDDDLEWATNPTYQPNEEYKYFIPDKLNKLDEIIKRDEDYDFLDWILPLGFISYILNEIIERKLLNINQKGLITGFDSGDFQLIKTNK